MLCSACSNFVEVILSHVFVKQNWPNYRGEASGPPKGIIRASPASDGPFYTSTLGTVAEVDSRAKAGCSLCTLMLAKTKPANGVSSQLLFNDADARCQTYIHVKSVPLLENGVFQFAIENEQNSFCELEFLSKGQNRSSLYAVRVTAPFVGRMAYVAYFRRRNDVEWHAAATTNCPQRFVRREHCANEKVDRALYQSASSMQASAVHQASNAADRRRPSRWLDRAVFIGPGQQNR